MNTDKLEQFLYQWTNYDAVISDSWRDEDETQLEFKLSINYLTKNTCNWAVKSVITHHKHGIEYGVYDIESAQLITEERIIHPIILAEEIIHVLVDLFDDCFENMLNISELTAKDVPLLPLGDDCEVVILNLK